MRRIVQSSGVLLIILLILGASAPVGAKPDGIPCGPYVEPGVCASPFHTGDRLFIRPGVAFVWLRAAPHSNGAVLQTVWPSGSPNLRVMSFPPSWDGYQSWYLVAPTSNLAVSGWVEQASLVASSNQSPPPKATWSVPMTASLKLSLPFGWIRVNPSSYAASVYTIYSNVLFTVSGTPDAAFDGVQWWWPVHVQIPGSAVDGWLEQTSIVPAAGAPTPGVPPVVTTTAAFQSFERGYMIWTASDQQIYVLYGANGGTYSGYPIASYGVLPDNPVSDPPPKGLVKPIRGFGRVWGNYGPVRQGLGWGLQPEQGYTATITNVANSPYSGSGIRITFPDGRTAIISGSSWNF